MARREKREMYCMVHLEPTLYGYLQHVVVTDVEYASTYLRGLLIKDLRERKLLSDEEYARMTGAAVA